ncbi:MFS transporter [candidate division KSB1 bacterium]|nr:MFS transporter [candidate division KSB1 bacterium]
MTEYQQKLKSNIRKLYVIKALRWFLIIMPILVLFFQENGLSMRQVFLLQSLFSVAIIVLEVPSGYFSDVVGRKITIIIGSIVSAIGFVVYSCSSGFYGFLAAELLLGFGASFISGTDSALLYDTLLALGIADNYKKQEGILSSIGNFSEGIAGILGGFLALISLRAPFYVETVLLFIALPITFSLFEPERQKINDGQNDWIRILKIVKFALHDHHEIKWLIMYSSTVGASTLTMVWFIQPYLKLVGLPLALFGIVWACLQFSVGLFALSAHYVESFAGRRYSLIALIFLSVTGYFLLSAVQQLWGMVFILIFYFVRGIHVPVLQDYINRLISSEIRASVLSVKNLIGRLIFAAVGPFLGWVSDQFSLSTAFIFAGFIFGVGGIITLFALNRIHAL